MMTDMIEKVARAICRSDHPCWSMVNEIMDMPSYAPGHEGDAGAITIAGVYRQRARAAIEAIFDGETMEALKSFWEWEQDNELFPLNEEITAVANLYAALTANTNPEGEE